MTKKLYLYWLLSAQESNSLCTQLSTPEGVSVSHKWPTLLGFDRSIWRDQKLHDVEKRLRLKNFFVTQTAFDKLIEFSDLLNIEIMSIAFTEELAEEEYDELRSYISTNDYHETLGFIEEQRYTFGRDVEEITFRFKAAMNFSHITVSRQAVMTVENQESSISELMSTTPIGLLSGTYYPTVNELVAMNHEP